MIFICKETATTELYTLARHDALPLYSGKGEGAGGGGGGASVPVGAYVTRDGRTRFEPNTIALLAVGIPFVWVTGRAIGRILRGLRGKR